MISIKPLDSPINQQQYGNITYRQYADTYNIDDRKVPYGPDMFYLSVNTIADKNFTFAVDEDGNLVAALVFDGGDIHIQEEWIRLLLIIMIVYSYMTAMSFLLSCAGQHLDFGRGKDWFL